MWEFSLSVFPSEQEPPHPHCEDGAVSSLRDNDSMTERDPRFERMRRYEPRRQPYVQVTDYERGRYHARVIGWIPGGVFIEYPKLIVDYVTTGQLYFKWVPTESAVRIRRADSIWLSVEDDSDWHEAEDARITFRPDPWTVYTQEEPGPGGD